MSRFLENHTLARFSKTIVTSTLPSRVSRCCLMLAAVFAMSIANAQAQDEDAVPDDPDYAYQGEYVGETTDGSGIKLGAQVIAMGDGKFGLVVFLGGLPGEGGSPVDNSDEATPENPVIGERDGDTVAFQGTGGKAEISDGTMTITHPDGDEAIATLKRVVRKSSTLGKEAPEGATVLFDGSNADAFENGEIQDGLLGATNCFTKTKLGDHSLHLEFRTPFMPKARGQGRGNSGVYVQGRYEVQVLDSFGLKGLNNECGGIYSISEPSVNMCYPPMTWQTYDIDFTAAKYNDAGEKTENARVTVKHNGVVIHDDVELPHGTPGYHAEGPGPDSLFLQDHSNPVHFRNIWVINRTE